MIYRKDLNRPLSSDEIDANFQELETKISLGLTPTEVPSLEDITGIKSYLSEIREKMGTEAPIVINLQSRLEKIETEIAEIKKKVGL